MATRSKRIMSQESPNNSESESNESKKRIEQLENELKEMKRIIGLSGKANLAKEEKISVTGDDYIKVMSLCPHELNLTTQAKGKGKIFTFKKMYEVKRILYRDLVDIMENHTAFTEQGLFFILDADVVRKHGLDEIYESLLNKEKIEAVLKGNQTDAVNMFKTANQRQQGVIAQMLIDDIVNGKEVDLNFIDRISRVTGYNLQEKAENLKKLLNKE